MISRWKKMELAAFLGLAALAGGCGKKPANPSSQIQSFISAKEVQAAGAALLGGRELPAEYKAIFTAARAGDWVAVSNDFNLLRRQSPEGPADPTLRGSVWQAVIETYGATELMANGGDKFFVPLGRKVIESIPPGSIYFGGTDFGRFAVTALAKSQTAGDPFFILTQNALADKNYLGYLRGMFGGKIYIPAEADLQASFDEYLQGARARLQAKKLRPGEQVKEVDGHLQVGGVAAVMSINAALAKVIFDKNPTHEFYLEQSFPLQWMFPYLEPHGLILKLNRQPAGALPKEILDRDHAYWTACVAPFLGDWLREDTSVQTVCDFTAKIRLQQDFGSFKGDADFLRNEMPSKALSKMRTAAASLYMWRANMKPLGESTPAQFAAKDDDQRQRLIKEADFAFRQAIALCPASPEAVYGYAGFLRELNRIPDAILVAQTGINVAGRQQNAPEKANLESLIATLRSTQ